LKAHSNALYALVTKQQVEVICLVFLLAAVIPYVIAVLSYSTPKKLKKAVSNGKD